MKRSSRINLNKRPGVARCRRSPVSSLVRDGDCVGYRCIQALVDVLGDRFSIQPLACQLLLLAGVIDELIAKAQLQYRHGQGATVEVFAHTATSAARASA